MEEHIIADRTLIKTARIVSAVFTPFSIPFVAFLILFLFSYLNIMPLAYKLIVLGVVYCFTILMPTLTIFLFRKIIFCMIKANADFIDKVSQKFVRNACDAVLLMNHRRNFHPGSRIKN